MTSERYQAYLEALEQVDRIDSDTAGTRAPAELRELVQDVLLCRDPADVEALLEQIAIAATHVTATGGLTRQDSIYLFNAAIACGPLHPRFGGREALSLVAG